MIAPEAGGDGRRRSAQCGDADRFSIVAVEQRQFDPVVFAGALVSPHARDRCHLRRRDHAGRGACRNGCDRPGGDRRKCDRSWQRNAPGLAHLLLQQFGGTADAAVHLGAVPNGFLRVRHLHQRGRDDARHDEQQSRRDNELDERETGG